MPIDWASVPRPGEAGTWMHELMHELFPLPRSLTGNGVRETLDVLEREVGGLERHEVPSGTAIFDWAVPDEWNVHEAWLSAPDGTRVVDVADSTLHLLGYSTPQDVELPLADLREHLHVHPENPDTIPYRYAFFAERWGFCLSRRAVDALADGMYRAYIDTTLQPGHLSYAETALQGDADDVFLLSTYVCHPALANDNLSGVVMLAALAKALRGQRLTYSYRFLWSPATLGPLCWLDRNRELLGQIRAGLVVSCVGDPGGLTYKRSRRGDTRIDRAAAYALARVDVPSEVEDWSPWGGDERQFCSPGFNLPVGAFSRTPVERFPEHHTSADDLDFVRPEFLDQAYWALLQIIDTAERDGCYRNLSPFGEPQLGRRGVYREIAGGTGTERALLWVLNMSDGRHSLLDVAAQSGMPLVVLREAADTLVALELLAPC